MSAPKRSGAMEWWPVEDVTTNPRGPYLQPIRDAWWVMNADGRVAMYRSPVGSLHPQCNTNRGIAERFCKREGGVRIVQLPLAFSPIRLEDYR